MTYMTMCRALALEESRALRAFALQGRLPKCTPVDYWAEWMRVNHRGAVGRAA